MKWFKHQSDARNSLKLRKVRRKYGADGYAIYWFCLESIAYDVDKDHLTFDLKEDAETIGFELNIQERRVEEIMTYMIEIGLFENTSGMITCLKLAESIDKSMTNSPKMRKWIGQRQLLNNGDLVNTCHDNVMTYSDSVKTCPELEVEVEVEKELEIKKEKKKKTSIEVTYPQELNIEAWQEWKAYKKQIKSPYKTERGEKSKITELIKISGGDKELQARIINQSIDQEWKGLFELKGAYLPQDKPKPKNKKPRRFGQ